MEKGFYNFGENFRDVERRIVAEKRNTSEVPACINTEFCLPSPENRNDEILTMVFIDMQSLDTVYPPETSFKNGTLFPNIDKPFYGGMCK